MFLCACVMLLNLFSKLEFENPRFLPEVITSEDVCNQCSIVKRWRWQVMFFVTGDSPVKLRWVCCVMTVFIISHLWKYSFVDNQLSFNECQKNFILKIKPSIWPEDVTELKNEANSDRIIKQLELNRRADKIFKILPPDRYSPEGPGMFKNEDCLVDNCDITYDEFEADALIFQNSDVFPNQFVRTRRSEQIWIAYFLESPPNTFDRKYVRKFRGNHSYNWTASYRSNSDIVTPYAKFERNNLEASKVDEQFKERFLKNSTVQAFIDTKVGLKVAWLVSNCHTHNDRLNYAKELAKFVNLDIYGKCGNMTCDKRDHSSCLDMINSNYKFYLAFENSNCPEYITEKFFKNALGLNDLNHLVLPIVMGPKREDYQNIAPPHSFIHIDDFKSPKDLAEFIRILDQDNELYMSYFRWKLEGQFIDTKFMCRVCALLNESYITKKMKTYSNIQDWWTCERV